MKRETLDHPKTHDLASRLGITRAQALGHLALLWNWTADYAIAGNVGKYPNGSISRPCDWMGDPDQFVNALVESGWLDVDPDHRLIIHDWAQHCENWVRAKAEKLCVTLLGQKVQLTYERDLRAGLKSGSDPDPSAALKSGSFPCDRTEPNRSDPNPTEPIPAEPPRTKKSVGGFFEKVSKKTIGNTSELMAWLATSKESDLPPDDYDTRVRVIGVAVRATTTEGIKNPVAVFVSLVRDRDWSKISDDQLTEAKSRYRTWKDSQGGSGQLAEVLRSPPVDPSARKDAKAEIARVRAHLENQPKVLAR